MGTWDEKGVPAVPADFCAATSDQQEVKLLG